MNKLSIMILRVIKGNGELRDCVNQGIDYLSIVIAIDELAGNGFIKMSEIGKYELTAEGEDAYKEYYKNNRRGYLFKEKINRLSKEAFYIPSKKEIQKITKAC